MGINSTEVSYGFGQLGSVFNDTASAITPPTGKVFVAITMLGDTVFNATTGLVGQNDPAGSGLEYVSTDAPVHNLTVGSETTSSGGGGKVIDASNTFPKGVTIYGRWTKITTNGATPILAYIGH